ncbi:MAG: FG-GAP repeat protein, partial [Planctomycetota bacterium]
NTEVSDEFGNSIDISDDTIVVGTQYEDSNSTGINGNQADNSATDSGAVYVFTRSGTTWSQQAYIKASNTEVSDEFGNSIDISGDTIVVGTQYEDSNAIGINGNQADNSAIDSGAVYVFTRSGTTWSQQAYIKASNTETNDVFGTGVAISGNILVVGAVYEDSNAIGINGNQADNSAADSGAVYFFTRSGTNWSQQAYIKTSKTEAKDWFGCSVAISGDTIIAGTYAESSDATGINGNQADNSAAESGAVYVFRQ